mgnify:CR=1 FL=1
MECNLLGEPVRCATCQSLKVTPYDDPALWETPGSEVVVSWNASGRLLRLTDGQYLCPICEKFTLTFEGEPMCWD